MVPAVLMVVALSSGASATPPCSSVAQVVDPAPEGAYRSWLRASIHAIAEREGVDGFALEAIARTETGMRNAVGRDCELGMFQIMPWWASKFDLDSPWRFWQVDVGATAAARIYAAGLSTWRSAYASGADNRCLTEAGWRWPELDSLTYAAINYNWGRAAREFRGASASSASIPRSTCRYAVRFRGQLDAARAEGTPRWP